MSKSVGNVIDPHAILEKYGAEPFRLWCAIEGNLDSTDLKCSYERIEGASKSLTKLWNVSKFVISIGKVDGNIALQGADKWILNELKDLVRDSDASYSQYDFHNPAAQIKHFIWDTFSSHYLELVKSRAYNQDKLFSKEEQNAAIFTLRYCVETILKLLAPINPFITSVLYSEFSDSDIHNEAFPQDLAQYETKVKTGDIVELDSAIWKMKKDNNLSLKSDISQLTIPHKFEDFRSDIMACHHAKKLEFGDHIEVRL
jgi:valyl-tRNA synthetase